MISPEPAPDATLDPWCVVPIIGERVLFGYAVTHPETGGLSWMSSTPVRYLDETAQRATTASGRRYALGRRIEPTDVVTEGEEARVAFELLIGAAATDAAAGPSISIDRHPDACWVTACKMARHLGITPPARSPVAVQDFLRLHGEAYAALRASGKRLRRLPLRSRPSRANLLSPTTSTTCPKT